MIGKIKSMPYKQKSPCHNIIVCDVHHEMNTTSDLVVSLDFSE